MRVPETKVFLTVRAVIPVCTFLLALGMVGSAQAAAQYDYIATTKVAFTNKKTKPVKAGSLTWECGGKGREHQCRIRGPWSNPAVSACRALAKQVGPITKYGHAGKWLDWKEIDACNAGIQGALLSPGVVQAPRGQTTKALPSPGVVQAPRGQIKSPLKTVPPAALRPPTQIVLSQVELDGMARTLNRSGSRRYQYVLFRRTPTRSKRMKLSVVRTDNINGVLLNRDRAAMERLDWGLYDDRMGNLVLVSFLADPLGNRVPYSITATSWGENIFTADRDNDGVIDLALGSRGGVGGGRLWMMAGVDFKRLLQCMEESALSTGGNDMFNAASLCVPCLDPNREPGGALTSKERGCVKGRKNRRSGAGILGGALNSEAVQGLLGEPECGPSKPGRGITSQMRGTRGRRDSDDDLDQMLDEDLEREVKELRIDANRARQDALDAYREGDSERGDDLRELAGDWEDLASAIEKVIGSHGSKRVFLAENAEEYRLNAWRGEVLGDPSDLEINPRSPSIGPDGLPQGGFADPRCSGNKTAMAQGTMWGDFCRNKDGSHIGMMECLRKMGDSIYAISGGRCWKESGPAGGERIVCRQEERRSGAGSDGDPGSGVAPGGSDSGSTEAGIGGGRRSGEAGRYIDTTPMGGFLAGFCAKAGCPDFENVRNVR